VTATTTDLTVSNIHGLLKHQNNISNNQISPRIELSNNNIVRRASDNHNGTYNPNYGHATTMNIDSSQNISIETGVHSATAEAKTYTAINGVPVISNKQSLAFTNVASVNTEIGTTMIASPELDQAPDLYRFDQVPFENLNVEEIWNWMMIADAENAQLTESSWD
jgi:hypothetical protein